MPAAMKCISHAAKCGHMGYFVNGQTGVYM